jgi:hypothetical protein
MITQRLVESYHSSLRCLQTAWGAADVVEVSYHGRDHRR